MGSDHSTTQQWSKVALCPEGVDRGSHSTVYSEPSITAKSVLAKLLCWPKEPAENQIQAQHKWQSCSGLLPVQTTVAWRTLEGPRPTGSDTSLM